MLTAEQLREIVSYDPHTGVMRWKVAKARRVKIGDKVGSKNGSGYLLTYVNGRRYKLHRLIWLYAYGRWPDKQVDHINRDRSDNRLCNLRLATNSQNQVNNGISLRSSCGLRGVRCLSKGKRRWVAKIQVGGKQKHLGSFWTKEDAAAAYDNAAREAFGDFYSATADSK